MMHLKKCQSFHLKTPLTRGDKAENLMIHHLLELEKTNKWLNKLPQFTEIN